MSREEKLKKIIMNDLKLKRIPQRDNKLKPIFKVCGICHKNKVLHHHFLCDSCWKEKYNMKGGIK